MTFLCPACHEVKPLADGLLLMENVGSIPSSGARHGAPAVQGRDDGPLVAVIVCGPCTGSILVDRAKVR